MAEGFSQSVRACEVPYHQFTMGSRDQTRAVLSLPICPRKSEELRLRRDVCRVESLESTEDDIIVQGVTCNAATEFAAESVVAF